MNKTLNLGVLVLDGRLQSRVEIDEDAVSDYALALENGDRFPAVLAFYDGIHYYLTDGYHRYHAHKRAGKASIEVEVVNGTFRDAIFHATSVNSKHGMRRSNADKRKAVMTLLEDFEWEGMSSSEIARHCGVSVAFVSNLRNVTGKQTESTVKYKDKDGEVKEKKKAAGRPAKEPELKEPAPEPKQEEADQQQEGIDMLLAENEELKARLAVAAMDATPEEKAMAEQTIAELREELRLAKIEMTAIRVSRDTFQAENAQLKKQVSMLQRKLKQAGVE
jgi:transposase